MLLILLILVVGLVLLICGIILYKKTYSGDGMKIFGGLLLIIGIIVGIAAIDNIYGRKVQLEEYENLKYQVENIEMDYIVTDANLRQQVLEMNNKISKNKIYGDNIWISAFYNPELGKCEKLMWKQQD